MRRRQVMGRMTSAQALYEREQAMKQKKKLETLELDMHEHECLSCGEILLFNGRQCWQPLPGHQCQKCGGLIPVGVDK